MGVLAIEIARSSLTLYLIGQNRDSVALLTLSLRQYLRIRGILANAMTTCYKALANVMTETHRVWQISAMTDIK